MCRLLFYFSDDLKSTVNPSCFSNCLKPQDPLQPAPSPVGEGILQIAATFPKFPNYPNTSLVACCPLSNSLPRGERTGRLLGLRVLRENRLYWLLFSFSDGLKSTVANPSCFSNRLQPQNLLQPAPSPVGEGWGEGILLNRGNLSQHSTTPIQALWLVALSLALSHGREDGMAVGIKGSAREQVVQAAFYFSDDLHQRL